MEKKEKKKDRVHPPLFQLTSRFLIFVNLFAIISIALYVTGSFNQFVDESLLFILRVLQVTSIATTLFSVFLLIQIIVFTIYYKDLRFLWHLFHFLFSFVLALIGFIFSGLINFLAIGTY